MRKLLSCLLALILLTLPTASLAAPSEDLIMQAWEVGRGIHTDITFTPGVFPMDEEIATILSDLLASLSFTIESSPDEEDPQRFAMGLGGKDVLTVAIQNEGEVSYVDSSLLDNTVAFTAEELQAVLIRMIVLGAQAQNMRQEDIDAMVAALEEEWQADTHTPQQDFTFDTAKLGAVILRVAGSMKEESYTGSSKNHDAAARKLTITLTATDVAEFMEIVCKQLRANESFMAGMGLGLSMTSDGKIIDAQTLLTEMPDRCEEMLTNCEDVVVTALVAEDDELVHMDFALVLKDEELVKDSGISGADFVYNRLTTADGVGHSAEYTVDVQKSKVIFSLNALTDSEKHIALSAAIGYVDESGALYDMAYLTVEGTKDYAADATKATMTVELAVKEKAHDDAPTYGARIDIATDSAVEGKDVTGHTTAALTLLGEKEPMITMNVDQTTIDGLEDIATDKADRPAQMSDEDFATYLTKVQASALTNAMTILQNLPDSLLRLVVNIFSK